ncbi:MAG: DUF4292 domain-containing protein [Bacteroidales bacterium]|nr:DUF4292 domain-containing protein [Bacteroidales bacterium]
MKITSPFLVFILFAFLSAVVFLNSCKTRKPRNLLEISDINTDSIYYFLKINEVAFNTLEARLLLNVNTADINQSFNANMRLLRDSVLWVSIVPFAGIEVARILITPDSVKILNRMENICYLYDIRFLKNQLHANMDFDMLQSVLTGNDLSTYDLRNLRINQDNNAFQITYSNRLKESDSLDTERFSHSILLEKTSYKIINQLFSGVKDSFNLNVSYRDFKALDEQTFPFEIAIEANSSDNQIEGLIKYSKITLNKDLNFPFTIPEKYQIMP